jgi:RND family efflux transporter MFP subunit
MADRRKASFKGVRVTVRPHLILAGAVSLTLLAACGGGKNAEGPGGGGMPPTTVNLGVVKAQTVRTTSEYVAQVRSRRSIDVQPQVEGYVRRIAVRPGDRVSRGALLMQIDPARQQQSVANIEAARGSRVAALRLAEQEKSRIEGLYKAGVSSRQELDRANAALAAAQSDVNSLDAQVAGERVQLRYYDVTAPEGGVVGDIPARTGDLVTPATRLTTIDQNAALEAYISVPLQRAAELRPGLDVELLANDGDAVVATGKIDFIAPRVSDATQAVVVKAPIGNATANLRSSQFTNARIIWNAREVPVVPATAVMRLGGQPFVFVAEGDGKSMVAKQRSVELGELTVDVYEVKSGVRTGERVVTSGVQKLRDGAPIAPEAPAPIAAAGGAGSAAAGAH